MTRPTSARGRGRPAGGTDARERILAEARRAFAERGYDGATIRAIASSAGVDPALVHHYFGTKDDLFTAAVAFPVAPGDVLESVLRGDPAQVGERMIRTFLAVMSMPEQRDAMVAVLRSAATNEAGAAMLREYITRVPLHLAAGMVAAPDAALRIELAMAQTVGILMQRYVLRLEPIASASDDEIVALVAPTLQRYLVAEPTDLRYSLHDE